MPNLKKLLYKTFAVILFLLPISVCAQQSKGEDIILGDWMTTEKNLIVNISKDKETFKANITWFDDTDNPSRPMNSRMDYNNPDKAKRENKIIGLSILHQLVFNAKSGRWEDGIIYDPLSGKKWSAVVSLTANGLLRVKGYWQFEFLSRSLYFKRFKTP